MNQLTERWIIFLHERFPLKTFFVLVSGISLSGIYLYKDAFSLLSFVFSFIGIFLFFGQLRLMDDVKDCDKDSIAHRERPIPRGLIQKKEAMRAIEFLQVILFSYCLILLVFLQGIAALTFACLNIYLWMMYKEFGIEQWISSRPVLYGIFHQFIIFLVVVFSVSAAHPEKVFAMPTWSLGLLLFGAFFYYDICRKLNPHAHPILATYIHFYGFRRTFEVAAMAMSLSAMGAIALNLVPFLLICEGAVLITLMFLFFQGTLYPIPEGAATTSLLLHVWAVPIYYFINT